MAEETVKEDGARSAVAEPPSFKLFLGGLSWGTNEDTLRTYFSRFGEISDVVVMRERVTQNPRGFGFITFKTEEAAGLACKEAHTIDGRNIEAKPSVPHTQGQNHQPRSKKLFVGGLASETKDEDLRVYFQEYGTVQEAQVMIDHTSGRSRGFGFVTFEDEESVNRVLKTGQMHELNSKQVEVKPATPKGSGPQSGRNRELPFAPQQGGYAYAPGRGYGPGRGYPDYRQAPFPMGSGYPMPGYGMPIGPQYGHPGMAPYAGYPPMMMNYGAFGGYGAYPGFAPQPGYPQAPGPQGQPQRFNNENAAQAFNGRKNPRRPQQPQPSRPSEQQQQQAQQQQQQYPHTPPQLQHPPQQR